MAEADDVVLLRRIEEVNDLILEDSPWLDRGGAIRSSLGRAESDSVSFHLERLADSLRKRDLLLAELTKRSSKRTVPG